MTFLTRHTNWYFFYCAYFISCFLWENSSYDESIRSRKILFPFLFIIPLWLTFCCWLNHKKYDEIIIVKHLRRNNRKKIERVKKSKNGDRTKFQFCRSTQWAREKPIFQVKNFENTRITHFEEKKHKKKLTTRFSYPLNFFFSLLI